jgi:lysozyme family protein
MKRTLFTLAVAALIASGSAFAQQSQPSTQTQPNQPAPTVNDRKQDQQDRIANGVDSGQLTAGETKNLESRESNLNREVRDDRSADGGKLTSAEQPSTKQSEPLHLPGQAQRQHGALRQQ